GYWSVSRWSRLALFPYTTLFRSRELWRFDPVVDARDRAKRRGEPVVPVVQGVSRGVSYWQEGTDARILYTAGHFLYAIDPANGTPVAGFGDEGRVDFKQGLGRDLTKIGLTSPTPGAIFEDLFYLPVRCLEGPGPSAPGWVRAYNIRTGEVVWTFHTIPQPGEYGYDTWPEDAWKYAGGANNWAGMAVDADRGLLY